jgi:drug/metabolite transporter (DMT)-like permease
MNATLIAVILSLFSAVAYATAAVAQERLASKSAGSGVLRLLGSSAWWSTVGLNATGALLHVVALKYGPLTVVQPLGALTLVAAVPLGARVAGRRVSAVEWRGTALTLLGLAAILATASGSAPDEVLSPSEAVAVAGVTAVLIGVLGRPGKRRGLRHATASGVASGVASALTQTVTVAATDRSGSLLSMQVIGVALVVAAFAAGGLLLSQSAYRDGLDAPLALVTLSNPVAAALIGLALLGERLQGGVTGALLALTGAGVAARGVILLTRATPATAPATDAALTLRALTTDAQPAPGISAAEARLSLADRPAAGIPVTGPRPTGSADAVDDDHPVAAVLALEPGTAAAEPAMVPRQVKPGHLTPL